MSRRIPAAIAELGFAEIFTIDAEFRPTDPNAYRRYDVAQHVVPQRFEPVCISAKSWTTGEMSSIWYSPGDRCPWQLDDKALVVCYQAAAEMSFFVGAGWEMPTAIVDLYPEYRGVVNGEFDASGKRVGADDHRSADGRTKYGLLTVALHYGLGSRTGADKRSMIERILIGPPYSQAERDAIVAYNCDDVEDTERLFQAMLAEGDIKNIGQALLRGDASRGFALRELNGLPLDCALARRLKENWHSIRAGVVRAIEERRGYDVFSIDPDDRVHFDMKKAAALVERLGMDEVWPRTKIGKFSFADPDRGTDHDKTLKMMATINPYLEDLRQTKRLLDRTTIVELPIGADGRCHGRYSPWVQVTGRSSPGKGAIFAMPKWTRNLIKPGPGRGVAYVDLKSAEFGVAAALSHDPVMKEDYRAMLKGTIECVYFEVAKWASQVPPDARVAGYKAVRGRWKMACLAMMYGQSPEGLALTTRITLSEARVIQGAFRERYKDYWTWSAREIVHAHARRSIETVAGWRMAVKQNTEERTLLNFHPQATCADIMRRAIALMADQGVAICEIVHDAVVVEDKIETLMRTVEITKQCWKEAGREVLDFELEADDKVCIHPSRYEDEEGALMWNTVMSLLTEVESSASKSKSDEPSQQ